GAMSGMLNTLLDINQIDSGIVVAEVARFNISEMFDRLRNEFTYHAQAKGLQLRVVTCTLSVCSDPRLLEQMIRNLLSNALKYTKSGKVLLGCRRRKGLLSIEVWDTGIGIPDSELQSIFEEYHQLDNAARERSRGLGLGLSIVQRLGILLGHRLRVRSRAGKGSAFTIEITSARIEPETRNENQKPVNDEHKAQGDRREGTILVVEDDPDVRELLELFLKEDGHRTSTAPDGIAALDMVTRGVVRPDLVLADFNLPKGMNGLKLAAALREKLHRQVPVIILTGDISTRTLNAISQQDCIHFNKPMKLSELTHVIQRVLPRSTPSSRSLVALSETPAPGRGSPVIFVVDDDGNVRDDIRGVLEDDGQTVEAFPDCETFLEAYRPGREACLLVDAYLPGMSGLELLQNLHDAGHRLPAIMITGNSDVPMAVQAMKVGASDFIEKPIRHGELLASVERALGQSRDTNKLYAWHESAANLIAELTPRQRQIMELVLAGQPSKNIAADLGISQRTVENHRATIMTKTGSKSLPALARLALAASRNKDNGPGA
ncbi:MAG: response regulator, partial [Hyphomicrobium sp.]